MSFKPKQGMDTDSKLNDVAGFLKYQDAPKSLEDMEEAIGQGVEESGDGGSLC